MGKKETKNLDNDKIQWLEYVQITFPPLLNTKKHGQGNSSKIAWEEEKRLQVVRASLHWRASLFLGLSISSSTPLPTPLPIPENSKP